jgi:hypothetical protein
MEEGKGLNIDVLNLDQSVGWMEICLMGETSEFFSVRN